MTLTTRHLLLAGLLALTVLAQPGLCPCWLIANVEDIHPHRAGNASRPHDHEYLFEMFPSQPAAVLDLAPNPVGRLIEHLLNSSMWQASGKNDVRALAWSHAPPTPPPRLSAS
jgi:hypothetical protein